MDLEARSLQPNVKAMLLAKLREYKSDLNNLKREIKRITSGNADQAAREELLEAGISDVHAVIWFVVLRYLFLFFWLLDQVDLISCIVGFFMHIVFFKCFCRKFYLNIYL